MISQSSLNMRCRLMVSSHVIRAHYPRPAASPRNLCSRRLPRLPRPGRGPCRGVGVYPERSRRALDSPFLYDSTFKLSNLPTCHRSSANSFALTFLADPHPLTPIASIFYENHGGRGPLFPLRNSPLTTVPPLFFSCTYKLPLAQTLSFDIHANARGVYGDSTLGFLKEYLKCRSIVLKHGHLPGFPVLIDTRAINRIPPPAAPFSLFSTGNSRYEVVATRLASDGVTGHRSNPWSATFATCLISTIRMIRWTMRGRFLRRGISILASTNSNNRVCSRRRGRLWGAPIRCRTRGTFLPLTSPVSPWWSPAAKTGSCVPSITCAGIMPRRWSSKRKAARSSSAVRITAGLTATMAR